MALQIELRAPNISRILSGSAEALREVVEGSEPALASAIVLTDLIKQLLSQPGSGVVRVSGGRSHQASAPGEPPAVDTGNLRASVGFQIRGAGRVGIGVQAGAPYWKFLEFGTRFIDPRPFLRPAIAFANAGMVDSARRAFRERAVRILAERRVGR